MQGLSVRTKHAPTVALAWQTWHKTKRGLEEAKLRGRDHDIHEAEAKAAMRRKFTSLIFNDGIPFSDWLNANCAAERESKCVGIVKAVKQ